MRAATKRRLKRDERRVVIEDAAAELLATRGYAKTRMLDIAAAAGVSRQLLLRHFATKQDLHRALLLRHRDELFSLQVAGMATDEPSVVSTRRIGHLAESKATAPTPVLTRESKSMVGS